MVTSVKVERREDVYMMARVISRSIVSPATNKELSRPLNYELLIGTHIPDPFVHRLGALVTMLLKDQSVVYVEVWQTDTGYWIADALLEIGGRERLKRGEGDTPIEAFINLAYEIHSY